MRSRAPGASRRHIVRHEVGQTAWTARQDTEDGSRPDLTLEGPYGPAEPRRHLVCLTKATVGKALPPFDVEANRRLIEHRGIEAATP